LSAKPLDRRNEKNITIYDWSSVATVAEEKTRLYHGVASGNALASHHQNVKEVARLYGWQVAVEYDIQQRYVSSIEHTHDIATWDATAVMLLVSKQCAYRGPPPSSLVSPTKRSAPADLLTPPPSRHKRARTNHCFRCGIPGHFPAECKAEATSANQPLCALAGTKARSKHALVNASGKVFCFTWARESACPFDTGCTNYHGCSICGGTGHGAHACSSRA
jgi:hypothetical protein